MAFESDEVIAKPFAGRSSSPPSWRWVEGIDLSSSGQLAVILLKRNLWKLTHHATIISSEGSHLESCFANKEHLASFNNVAHRLPNIFFY